MAAKPVATIGSMHSCPMCSGTVPHVGGAVLDGDPTVLMNGKPVAIMGSTCQCTGAIDTVVQGQPFVFINGKPVACVGDMTAHGGVITTGESNITYTALANTSPATMPVKNIPFPKITAVSEVLTVLSGNSLKEAKTNQAQLKQEDKGDPSIRNLKWIKDEVITRQSTQIRQITLTADVVHIAEGETVTITFEVPKILNRSEETVHLSGTVENKTVTVVWEIEDLESNA